MYPNLGPIDIVKKFFIIFSKWSWSDTPVLIEEALDEPNIYHNKDQYFKKYFIYVRPDFLKTAKMHIITPSFPCMNST
jgi:poly(A) polymerase Pap1